MTGIPQAGIRREISWPASKLAGWNDTSLEIGTAFVDQTTKPLMLDLQTSDVNGSSLTGMSFTEPGPNGAVSTTSGIAFQAPLPWLQLKPYQSAAVNSYDCSVQVIASRPSSARRWELRVAVYPKGPGLGDRIIPTFVALQTDADRPPFRAVRLDMVIQGSSSTGHIVITSHQPSTMR